MRYFSSGSYALDVPRLRRYALHDRDPEAAARREGTPRQTLAKRDPQQALVHFHRALDLDKDTKDQQMIKQQIESLTNSGRASNAATVFCIV